MARPFRQWLCSVGAIVLVCGACQQLEEDGDAMPVDTDFDLDPQTSGGSLLSAGGDDDSGGGDPTQSCDPVSSIECGTGEKCTAILQGGQPTFACVAESGTAAVGETCTVDLDNGLDGCTTGTACLGEDAGICRTLCKTDANCEAGLCLPDPVHDVTHCANECSPFEPSCDGQLQCRRQSDRYACVDPADGNVGGAFDPCQLQGDAGCAEGLLCVTGALVPGCVTGGCCVPLCDLSSTNDCALPTTCHPAIESPAPGFESIGGCFVPA